MAISAKFIADFTSFNAAVKAAQVELTSFTTGASKVESALKRMGDSFSGKRIIQEATLMTQTYKDLAQQGIGLTESEARKMNATLNEAISKYRAMGTEAKKAIGPETVKEWETLERATRKADTALEQVGASTSKLGSFFKSTFAQFTLASLAASAIQSVTQRVGEFIAVGVKLPAVETSFGRLTAAMKQDGDQMLANMTTATMGLVSNYDLMLSANKAMLLGLPVTSESMGDLAKAATTLGRAMGMDATKSVDDLITALGRSSPMILDNLGLTVKVGEANEAYAEKLGKTTEQLTDAEKKMAFYEAAMEAARKKTKELGEQTKTLGEIGEAVWVKLGNTVSSAVGLINVQIGKALSSKDSFLDLLKAIAIFGNAGSALTALQERDARRVTRGPDVNLPNPEVPKADIVTPVVKAAGESARKAAEDFREFNKVLAAYKKLGEDYNKTMASTDAMLTKLMRGSIESKHSQSILHGELREGLGTWLRYNQIVELVPLKTLPGMQVQFDKTIPKVKEITIDFGALSQALANLAQISGGSLGKVAQGFSQIVGSVDAAKKGIDTFKSGLSAASSGSAIAGIAGMATGIMGIVSAAIAAGKAIKGIWDAFDRNKGRDLVKDFAESFGGFDALHNQLLTLGDAGEQLWIKLTQGVGRNNPAQAERVIQEVEEALAKQKAAQDAATISTEAGAQATIETATEAAKALDELNGRLETNADAWGAWSEDVTGFLQKLANDIRAMPLPGPAGPISGTGTFNGGGGTLRGGGGGSDGGYAPMTINLEGEAAWSGLVRVAKRDGVA